MSAEHVLLAVSVGARREVALANIETIEHALATAFPHRSVHRAFLCAAFHGNTPGPEKALSTLRAQGTKDILVQPLLLTAGKEYEKLRSQTCGLRMGRPLLSETTSRQTTARAILDSLPPPGETVHLLVGHAGNAGTEGRELSADFAALGRTDVFVYHPEQDLTHISHAMLHPLLLTCGVHAQRDLCALQTRLETTGCAVTCSCQGLGALPGISEIFVSLAREVDT